MMTKVDLTAVLPVELVESVLDFCDLRDQVFFMYTSKRNYIIGHLRLFRKLTHNFRNFNSYLTEHEQLLQTQSRLSQAGFFREFLVSDPLLKAIAFDQLSLVEQVIQEGFSVDGHVLSGLSLLTVSINHGSHSVFDMLLSRGANPNQTNVWWHPRDDAPLMAALQCREERMFRQLLIAGADLANQQHVMLDLFWLYSISTIHIARQHGGNLRYRDVTTGLTTAHFAVFNTNHRVIGAFGPFLPFDNQEIERGMTPLHLAIYLYNPEAIHDLLNAGANLNIVSRGGSTPLHYACVYRRYSTLVNLLAKGAHVNQLRDDGKNELHCVILGAAQELERRQSDLNSRVHDYAVFIKSVEIRAYRMADLLIRHGVNADVCDAQDQSPAAMAIEAGFMELAAFLDPSVAVQEGFGIEEV